MDWYLPDEPNGRGLLWIHGGGWENGRKEQWGSVAEHFCRLGYTCASAEYRLVPNSDLDGMVADVRLAMQAFRARDKELGFESNLVAAAGSSAGGASRRDAGDHRP